MKFSIPPYAIFFELYNLQTFSYCTPVIFIVGVLRLSALPRLSRIRIGYIVMLSYY
jgi:hypothetical protein